jgi:hypothetical protein
VRGGGKFPSTRDPDTREISSSTSHPGLGAQTLAPSGTQQVPQVSVGAVVPDDQPVDTPVHPVKVTGDNHGVAGRTAGSWAGARTTVIGDMFPRASGSTHR